jgi:hypothetical protein
MLPNGMHRMPPGAAFPGGRAGMLARSDSLSGGVGGAALRASESDYTQLSDIRAAEAAKRKSAVEDNMVKHRNWNKGWDDSTWRPITPPIDDGNDGSDVERDEADPLGKELRGFRSVDVAVVLKAKTHGRASLPTPPESIASPVAEEETRTAGNTGSSTVAAPADGPSKHTRSQEPVVRFASPPPDGIIAPRPVSPEFAFRLRTGRAGMRYVDRRIKKRTHDDFVADAPSIYEIHPSLDRSYLKRQRRSSSNRGTPEAGTNLLLGSLWDSFGKNLREDRMQFDNDFDDEEDEDFAMCAYNADPNNDRAMWLRAQWMRTAQQEAVALQQQQQQHHAAQAMHHQQQLQQQARIARMAGGGGGAAGQQQMQHQQGVRAGG